MHKERLSKWDRVLSEMEPGSVNESAVKELNEKVNSMESQISELLSLLKSGNFKTE